MTEAPEFALCGSLTEGPLEALPMRLESADVDLIEWRLDAFIRDHSLEAVVQALPLLAPHPSRKPVLVTNRPRREGGAFEDADEAARLRVLKSAVEAGAEWVDLEHDVQPGAITEFLDSGARVVLSRHDFSGTPETGALRSMLEEMAKSGAQVLKLVTYASRPEDNLRTLDLIPFARRELGVEAVAFCMGPLGRWSRVACLLLGAPWSYVRMAGSPEAAPGQLTAEQMRMILTTMG